MKDRPENTAEDWIATATKRLKLWEPDVFFEALRTPQRDAYASLFREREMAVELVRTKLEAATIKEPKPFHIMNIEAPGGCWELGTQIQPEQISLRTPNGEKIATHTYRLVYLICHALVVDEGEVVRHLCNNRACVRPDHLLLGSQSQNILDDQQRKYAGHTPQGRGQALNAHVEKHLQERPDPFVKEPLTRARSSEVPGEFD